MANMQYIIVMGGAYKLQTRKYYHFHGVNGRGLAQDAPFFYTLSHLSELHSFKSII